MKIGVIVESFCEELHTALQSAAKMGIQGVQIYACHSSHKSLIEMSSAERADLLKYIKDLGMEVSSICGDLGGHGFQDKEGNARRIELSKQIIDACCELDTKVMTTHVGVVPTKDESPVYQEMVRVAKVVGEYASANGVTLAIETGPEPAVRLRHYLEDIGAKVSVSTSTPPTLPWWSVTMRNRLPMCWDPGSSTPMPKTVRISVPATPPMSTVLWNFLT